MNQRKDNRVRVDWPARVLGKGLGMTSVKVSNVSIGGLYFESSSAMPVGTLVMAEVAAAHAGRVRTIKATGTIAHVSPLANDPASHGHGLRFHRISDQDLWFLLALWWRISGNRAGGPESTGRAA